MNIIKGIGAVLCMPLILLFGLLYLIVNASEDKRIMKTNRKILDSL